jgi:MFS family permease
LTARRRTHLTGLGSGLCFAALANVVVDAAPAGRTGVVAGMNANIRTIGGSVGSAVLATVLTVHLQPNGYPAEHGYTGGSPWPRLRSSPVWPQHGSRPALPELWMVS